VGGDAVRDPGQSAHAARKHDHRVGGIRATGHIRADVSIGLELDFSRSAGAGRAKDMAEKVGAAFDAQLFGKDPEGAIGRDEIYGLHVRIASNGKQKVFEENRSAGAGSGDSQILRRVVRQGVSGKRSRLSIGTLRRRSQGVRFATNAERKPEA